MNYKYYFWQPTASENLGRLIMVEAAAPHLAKLKLARTWTGDLNVDEE